MAAYADIPLVNPSSGPCSGAVFELHEPASESEIVDVDGWEVEVRKGQRSVVARGGRNVDYETAFDAALIVVQKALDLMAVRGVGSLLAKPFGEEHVVWWGDKTAATVFRIVNVSWFRMQAEAFALSEDGTPTPTGIRSPRWHESFRFFRLSQASDDLFDAYRNAYLALESILSDIEPQKLRSSGKVAEGEGTWFRRALEHADEFVALSSVASACSDPVQAIYDEFFVSMRSAMSHAKSGRRVLLPLDDGERSDVLASLQRVVGFYLALAEARLGVERIGGGLTPMAFQLMADSVLETIALNVSDDRDPLDFVERLPGLSKGRLHGLRSAGKTPLRGSVDGSWLWRAPVADLSGIGGITRVVGLSNEKVAIVADLRGALLLDSEHTLEVVLGVKGSNHGKPRELYSY